MPFATYRPSLATVGAMTPALGLTEMAVNGGPIVPTAIGTAKVPTAVQTSSTLFQAFRCNPGECTIVVPFVASLERPGGILSGMTLMGAADVAIFIDDLLPQPSWPTEHTPKVRVLIADLERRQDFVATKPAWSSGLMMLVRTSAV
jgi:hypothetical protein